MIPTWWQGLVLVLACFRWTRLVGWDDFPPIVRVRNAAVGARLAMSGSSNALAGVTGETPHREWVIRRPLLHHFLGCAYCVGFWVSLAAYLLWRWFPTEVMYAAAPFALSAAVGVIARNLDP